MTYLTGTPIGLGDAVEHAGSRGVVIALTNRSGPIEATPGFEWTRDCPEGLWVQFSNGAVVNLVDADEDLAFVSRATTFHEPA